MEIVSVTLTITAHRRALTESVMMEISNVLRTLTAILLNLDTLAAQLSVRPLGLLTVVGHVGDREVVEVYLMLKTQQLITL